MNKHTNQKQSTVIISSTLPSINPFGQDVHIQYNNKLLLYIENICQDI